MAFSMFNWGVIHPDTLKQAPGSPKDQYMIPSRVEHQLQAGLLIESFTPFHILNLVVMKVARRQASSCLPVQGSSGQ
jgi:hypothetical protein